MRRIFQPETVATIATITFVCVVASLFYFDDAAGTEKDPATVQRYQPLIASFGAVCAALIAYAGATKSARDAAHRADRERVQQDAQCLFDLMIKSRHLGRNAYSAAEFVTMHNDHESAFDTGITAIEKFAECFGDTFRARPLMDPIIYEKAKELALSNIRGEDNFPASDIEERLYEISKKAHAFSAMVRKHTEQLRKNYHR